MCGPDKISSIHGTLGREQLNVSLSRHASHSDAPLKRRKKRIFLCILGIHTLCLTLFSSGLTVYWTRASESGIKWAVVIEAGAGAGRQCPG